METGTVQLYLRDCSSCGQRTVTSSLCVRPDLCPLCFRALLRAGYEKG